MDVWWCGGIARHEHDTTAWREGAGGARVCEQAVNGDVWMERDAQFLKWKGSGYGP